MGAAQHHTAGKPTRRARNELAIDSQDGKRGSAGVKKMLLKTGIVLKETRCKGELGENWEGINKVEGTCVS